MAGTQRIEWIAQRHRWLDRKDKASAQHQAEQKLTEFLKNSDELSLSKLLVEFVLIDSAAAYHSSDKLPEALAATVKTYRIDTSKIVATVERERMEKQKSAKPRAIKPKAKRPTVKRKIAA
jgi:hypothetical protein